MIIRQRTSPIISTIGKIIAAKIPTLRSSLNRADTVPTTVGPIEQPTSPANARKANIAVPPRLSVAADKLKVPGQRIPTAKPHRPQPSKMIRGSGESEIIR